MKHIIILVGNIGSGKSTLCHKFSKKDYVIISRDSLRYGIGGGNYIFNPKYESIIWSVELEIVKQFLKLGVNLVIDEVGINKAMRSRYISLAKKFDYKIDCYEFPKISMKKSVDRRMTNPHGQPNRLLWEAVWEKFNKMYEKPTLNEGFNKIIKVK